jgi:hypothetical protein
MALAWEFRPLFEVFESAWVDLINKYDRPSAGVRQRGIEAVSEKSS